MLLEQNVLIFLASNIKFANIRVIWHKKNMHEYLIQFKNLYGFYHFFFSDFLGENVLIPPYQSVSQGAKCANIPNLYTTYFQWAWSTRRSKTCKNSKPATLKCQISDDLVSASQLEIVEEEYSTVNKQGAALIKITKLTEWVSSKMTYKRIVQKSSTITASIHNSQILCIEWQTPLALLLNMVRYFIHTILKTWQN